MEKNPFGNIIQRMQAKINGPAAAPKQQPAPEATPPAAAASPEVRKDASLEDLEKVMDAAIDAALEGGDERTWRVLGNKTAIVADIKQNIKDLLRSSKGWEDFNDELFLRYPKTLEEKYHDKVPVLQKFIVEVAMRVQADIDVTRAMRKYLQAKEKLQS